METFNIDSWIASYALDLELKGRSKRTIEDYAINMRFLKRFFEARDIKSWDEVDSSLLREFQLWFLQLPTRQGRQRGVVDRNHVLAAIKAFFKFLKEEGIVTIDPAESLEYAKRPKRLPKAILSESEARKIIEAIDTNTVLGFRNRTILEVLYSTAIRRNELLHLKVNDVDLENEVLRVNQGKGGYDRVVPLTEVACRFLETYMKAIRSQLCKFRESEYLFISRKMNRIHPDTLGEIVKKYAKLAGLKKRVTPHVWRHSCATHLLKNEAKLRHVQAILGHKCLSTTEKYLHLTINDLKQAHAKYHPRGKQN